MRKSVIMVLAVVAVVAVVSSCDMSTKGATIETYAEPGKALLVLDIQKDFTAEGARMPVNPDQVEGMLSAINDVAAQFEKSGDTVVYIRNVFPRNEIGNLFRRSAAVVGSPGVEFDERLTRVSDLVFDKSRPDAFSNAGLERLLVAKQISEVIVAGVFADQCVYWTSRGAINRGYKVTYLSDAVAAKSSKGVDKAAGSLERLGATIAVAAEVMGRAE
jgi:nicotinamidase-related amidase